MARPTNAELNELKDTIELLVKRAEELVGKADDASKESVEYRDDIRSAVAQVDEFRSGAETKVNEIGEKLEEVKRLSFSCAEWAEKISELESKAEQVERSLEKKKQDLNDLTDSCHALEREIEGLLPGATSAGLASAFEERKRSFSGTIRVWGTVFVLSMIALFAIAYIDPITLQKTAVNEGTLLSFFLARTPFVIPIVWLAVYAGRRHNQALRLEEDYAHKEALSKSFEGYKAQLLEIEAESDEKDATLDLIQRTLEALSLQPGRIYNGGHEDITPATAVRGILAGRRKKEEA